MFLATSREPLNKCLWSSYISGGVMGIVGRDTDIDLDTGIGIGIGIGGGRTDRLWK
jgi:hypothetical protein